jgi:uncharacterized membrane protein YedE/YeeE
VKRNVVALLSGLLFSVGLAVSGMTRPQKVLAFLDVFGRWDPSLAFVMIGAIGVSALAFRARARLAAPVLGERFHTPSTKGPVGPRVVLGAAIFGVGWGLSGMCPGPAVASLATGKLGPAVFVGSMLAAMALYHALQRSRSADAEPAARASGAPTEAGLARSSHAGAPGLGAAELDSITMDG